MKLTGEVVEVPDLSADDRGEMLDLMNRHYHDVCPRAFAVDLAEKQWVIVVRDSRRQMQGFSTQMVLDVVVDGRKIKALFSGDTIVDRQHWGDRALPQAGGRLALSLADEWPRPHAPALRRSSHPLFHRVQPGARGGRRVVLHRPIVARQFHGRGVAGTLTYLIAQARRLQRLLANAPGSGPTRPPQLRHQQRRLGHAFERCRHFALKEALGFLTPAHGYSVH